MLPPEFWVPNEFNVRGGVEAAFMSTTRNRDVALDYAMSGKVGLIFEIQVRCSRVVGSLGGLLLRNGRGGHGGETPSPEAR